MVGYIVQTEVYCTIQFNRQWVCTVSQALCWKVGKSSGRGKSLPALWGELPITQKLIAMCYIGGK